MLGFMTEKVHSYDTAYDTSYNCNGKKGTFGNAVGTFFGTHFIAVHSVESQKINQSKIENENENSIHKNNLFLFSFLKFHGTNFAGKSE